MNNKRPITSAEDLMRRLLDGGSIVSSATLSASSIALARSADRLWVDTEGYGYVYVPGPLAFAEHAVSWHRIDADTANAPPFGTIRACRVCGCLTVGGPTACVRCVKAAEQEMTR